MCGKLPTEIIHKDSQMRRTDSSSTTGLTLHTTNLEVRYRGKSVPVSSKEFDLYCLLAITRLENTNEGYVAVDQIAQLPSWQKNKIESIGKQIRRHTVLIQRAKGVDLIEAQQKVNGPFRLAVSPRAIRSKGGVDQLRNYLGLMPAIAALTESQLNNFYRFIVAMWRGTKAFNEGLLTEATSQYSQAAQRAVLGHHRISALVSLARAYDRIGNYDRAQSSLKEGLEILSRVRHDRDWASARVYGMVAWLHWRKGEIEDANRWYADAQQHLGTRRNYQLGGSIYNGMGLIAKERDQLSQAATLYHQALECGVLAEDYYSIQAAYFNIGRLHSLSGDRFWDGRHFRLAREQYRVALRWVRQCIFLCDQLVIADDASDDRILLAYLYRRLGRLEAAYVAAQEANKMAVRANNQRCIALSCHEMAAVHVKRGEKDQARSIVTSCKKTIKPQFLKHLRESEIFTKDLPTRQAEQ
jgi:tetratricopeptide (TPR) repeat protein